jgi:hypothetical protein
MRIKRIAGVVLALALPAGKTNCAPAKPVSAKRTQAD